MKTARGLDVSTTSNEVIDSINNYNHEILTSGLRAEEILSAAKDHPDNLLIQTYAGSFFLFAQQNDMTTISNYFLTQAEKQLPHVNQRERLTYYAIKAWADLEYEQAIALFSTIIELYPRDILAIKYIEWLLYCTGMAFKSKRYLALCESCLKENPNDMNLLAMYSFALAIAGDFTKAKETVWQADTPWAHHTLGHVYLLTGEIDEGIKKLKYYQPRWQQTYPLVKGHIQWHLGILYLTNRDEKAALDLIRPDIWGPMPETVLEQIGLITLLWRMDNSGFPQDDYYKAIVPYLGQHSLEQHTAFNSIIFLYCLARAGEHEQVKKSLQAMENYAKELPNGYYSYLWNKVALPYSYGLLAFLRGDYAKANELIEPIIADCYQLGGGDVQDGLIFYHTYLLSLLRSQRKNEAYQFLLKYLPHYQNTALTDYWFTTDTP